MSSSKQRGIFGRLYCILSILQAAVVCVALYYFVRYGGTWNDAI
jgi:hypothetical protein